MEVVVINSILNLELTDSCSGAYPTEVEANKNALPPLIQIFTACDCRNSVRRCTQVAYISLRQLEILLNSGINAFVVFKSGDAISSVFAFCNADDAELI